MKKYVTETREFPHPRSSQAISAIAKRRGSCVGVDFAEAFMVIRIIVR